MKKHFSNITNDASRRKALKELVLLGSVPFLPCSLFSVFEETPTIHFVGLGKGGSRAVEFLHKQGVKGKFTCISNPEKRPDLADGIRFIPFIPPTTNYFQRGTEVYRIPNRISDMEQKIEIPVSIWNIFKSNDKFVLLSGLGGYTGTFMTEKITLWLHGLEKPFLSISSLPFRFEGRQKKQYAQNSIDRLKDVPNFTYHDLEIIRSKYDNPSIKSAFEKANELLYEAYKANSPM